MRRQPERAEQEAVKKLLSAMGAKFFVAGTTRRRGDYHGTMQTPGLPDLPLVFLPLRDRRYIDRQLGVPVWKLVVIEVKSATQAKTKSGGLSVEQAEVKRLCQESDVPFIHGDLNAIIKWLIDEGFLKHTNVPHYRVPK